MKERPGAAGAAETSAPAALSRDWLLARCSEPPTQDDVSIALDGRPLTTRDDVLELLDQIREKRESANLDVQSQ